MAGLFGLAGRATSRQKIRPEDNRLIGTISDPLTGEEADMYASDIVADVKAKFTQAQMDRKPLELVWVMINNYKNGNQYLTINPQLGAVLDMTKMFDYEEREAFNQVAPIFETRMAYLNRMKPILAAHPATGDMTDVYKAKLVKSILRGTMRKMKYSKKLSSAIAWAELTGTVFHKNIWNADKGCEIDTIQKAGKEIRVREGEPEIHVVPPFELFVANMSVEEVQEQPFIMQAKAVYVGQIFEDWGIRVDPTEMEVYSMDMNKVGSGGIGYTTYNYAMKSSRTKNSALVIEYYEKPTKQFPKGRFIVIAGGQLALYAEKLPYRCGDDGEYWYPFTKQVCIPNPGCFYGTSILERVLPLQRRYNAVRNRMAEYLNRIAIGVWVAEEGTILNLDQLETEGTYPGCVVFYGRGTTRPPELLENPVMPPEMSYEDGKLINDFYRISGVSELARESGAPTGIGSGIALDILREQDSTRLALTADALRDVMVEDGQMILRLYKEFAVGDRVIKDVGDSMGIPAVIVEWSADDITTDDVYFDTETELSDTPAQRSQKIVDVMQYGVFSDGQTGQQVADHFKPGILDALNLGLDADTVINDFVVDTKRAERENLGLEKGIEPKRNIFDNDDIHYRVHRQWRLSAEFEALAIANPAMVEAFDRHIMLHDETMRKAAMEQQMQAAMMQQAQAVQTPIPQGVTGQQAAPVNIAQ